MALNPQLIHGADFPFPANKGVEYTYVTNSSVKLKLNLPDRTIKEEGMVFLTSARLVFVKNPKSKTNANFHGIEMPLHLIEKPKFEQPLFGVNYLAGTVKPLVGDPNCLQASCTWNIMFTSGNSERFLSTFSHVYEAAKKKKTYGSIDHLQESFVCGSSAYIDPNDPLHLYINEPVNQNMYQPQNFSQNHYVPVSSTNMSNASYPNNPTGTNYGNAVNATNVNAAVPCPLRSVNGHTTVYNGSTNPCENNSVSYPAQNNASFCNHSYPSPNVPYGSQGGNPQYNYQSPYNFGQPNYNPQGQNIYRQPGQAGCNNYSQQNYGQQPHLSVNNEMLNSRHDTGYNNSMNMGYQDSIGRNGAPQQNQMNPPPWDNSQQPANSSRVTELTSGQPNNNANMPYRR